MLDNWERLHILVSAYDVGIRAQYGDPCYGDETCWFIRIDGMFYIESHDGMWKLYEHLGNYSVENTDFEQFLAQVKQFLEEYVG